MLLRLGQKGEKCGHRPFVRLEFDECRTPTGKGVVPFAMPKADFVNRMGKAAAVCLGLNRIERGLPFFGEQKRRVGKQGLKAGTEFPYRIFLKQSVELRLGQGREKAVLVLKAGGALAFYIPWVVESFGKQTLKDMDASLEASRGGGRFLVGFQEVIGDMGFSLFVADFLQGG